MDEVMLLLMLGVVLGPVGKQSYSFERLTSRRRGVMTYRYVPLRKFYLIKRLGSNHWKL